MADSVVIRIDGDTTPYKNALSGLGKVTNASVKVAAGAIKGLAVATAAVTAAVGKLGSEVVNVGQAFESSFAMVETIMDQSAMSAEAMQQSILSVSTEMGVSAAELSESVYNAISATGDTANAVSLVASATKLATAGFTDSASALSVLTTAMNAYGLSATEAEAISDSLIMVQNLGVTTISELSSSMGKAIASASAYGVDLSNLESAYVSLTKAGINTAESTTYISSMLKELGDEGTSVAKILKEQTGKTFSQYLADGNTLADALSVLSSSVNNDSTALMNLWSSAEAGKASNAIVSQGLATFNENLKTIAGSAGATETAYSTMCNTLEHQTQLLKNNITNLGISIYQSMESDFAGLVGMANSWVEEFNRAFDVGGIDGLIGAVSSKIPELLDLGTKLASSVADGIMKELPNIVSRIMSKLPSILSTAFSMSDTLITSLFQVASNIMYELVYMLPELIPSLVQGLAGVAKAVVKGVFGVVDSAIAGFMDRYSADVSWERFAQGLDSTISGEISATINADVDTSGATKSIEEAIAELKEKLAGIDILSDGEQQTIMSIINGDIDPIIALLESKGVDSEKARQVASSITAAWYNLKAAVENIDGIDNIEEIAGFIDDYDAIVTALKGKGMTDAEAKAAATSITKAWENFKTAIANIKGLNVVPTADFINASYDMIVAALTEHGMSAEEATSAAITITTAWENFKAAVTSITGIENVTEIADLIGKDYQTIVDALKGKGLTDADAKSAASAITSYVDEIRSAIVGTDLILDTDVTKIAVSIGRDKQLFIDLLKQFGLTEAEIAEIVSVYDQAAGSLTNKMQSLFTLVGDKLTDGKEDTDGIKSELLDKIANTFKEANEQVDKFIGNPEKLMTYKENLAQLETETIAWMNNYGLKGTDYAKSHLADLQAISDKVKEIVAEIDAAKAATTDVGQNAYNLTRAGATTDTETITLGVQYAYQSYKLDVQQVEDDAKAAKASIDEAWAKGFMSDDEHLVKEEEINKNLSDDKEKLKSAYTKQLSELFNGITEAFAVSFPEDDKLLRDIADKLNMQDTINSLLEQLRNGDVDAATVQTKLQEYLNQVFGEGIRSAEVVSLASDTLLSELNKGIINGIESLNVENPLYTLLNGIFGSDAFVGLDVDTSSLEGWIKTAFGGLGDNAADGYTSALDNKNTKSKASGKTLAEESIEGAAEALDSHSPSKAFYKLGEYAGQGFVNGLNSKYSSVYYAAKRLANAAKQGATITLEVHSSSKAFEKIGRFTGAGLERGMEMSMRDAVKTASRLSTSILNAANLPFQQNVSVQGFSESAQSSIMEGNTTSINLDGKLIAKIQGMNNSAAIAIQNARRITAIGGK